MDLSCCRAASYGYNADVISEQIPVTFYEPALDVCEELFDFASRQGAAVKPLIFAVHSLGGLLAARTLVMAKTHSDHWQSIYECAAGISFFTPWILYSRTDSRREEYFETSDKGGGKQTMDLFVSCSRPWKWREFVV